MTQPNPSKTTPIILKRNSVSLQVPGVKEGRKLLRKTPPARKSRVTEKEQAIISTSRAVKGKVVALHSPRTRVPEMRNVLFALETSQSQYEGKLLLIEGMPPRLELGNPGYPHGSILHGQDRYVLDAAHSIREGMTLHGLKSIEPMKSQVVPAKLAMRITGPEETVILMHLGMAEHLPGAQMVLTAYAPDSPHGKVLAKAAGLIKSDRKVRSIGTRALAGSQLSEVSGFTLLDGEVVLGLVSRKSDDHIYLATIQEFKHALGLGTALWNKVRQLRDLTQSVYRKTQRLSHLDQQLSEMHSARRTTAKAATSEMQQITELAQSLGLPVPEIALTPVTQSDLIDRLEHEQTDELSFEPINDEQLEIPDSGDDLLDMDL